MAEINNENYNLLSYGESYPYTAPKMMANVLLALVPLYVIGVFYYGPRLLICALYAIISCFVADVFCIKLKKESLKPFDVSSIITACILTLLLPASVPYWLIIIASVTSIVVAKHPFGGFGNNIFNPAAVGFAFVSICWPQKVFTYPAPFNHLPLSSDITAPLFSGINDLLKLNSIPTVHKLDVLMGKVAGPAGTTAILVLLAVALFLIIRKTINWKITFICLASCAAFAYAFPRIDVGRLNSVFFELCSGILLFGSIFMATDPGTIPQNKISQIFYGFFLGIFTMLFRYFGSTQGSFAFALIIANAISPTLDRITGITVKVMNKAENMRESVNAEIQNRKKGIKASTKFKR